MRGTLVRGPISQVVIAAANVVIEAAGDGLGNRHKILVAPISRAGQHHDAPSRHVQPRCQIGHHPDRVCIVAVVEQYFERVLVEHVHAARGLEEGGIESTQALAYRIEFDTQ